MGISLTYCICCSAMPHPRLGGRLKVVVALPQDPREEHVLVEKLRERVGGHLVGRGPVEPISRIDALANVGHVKGDTFSAGKEPVLSVKSFKDLQSVSIAAPTRRESLFQSVSQP